MITKYLALYKHYINILTCTILYFWYLCTLLEIDIWKISRVFYLSVKGRVEMNIE